MTITPELKRAVERGQPVRIEDPETDTAHVLVREDEFRRLCERAEGAHEAGEVRPADTDPTVDGAWREGWEAEGMSDYDDYERHRP